MNLNFSDIKTLGALKAAGYQSKSIKQEMRDNLIAALKERKNLFKGILGFEDTVIPDLQRAVLSKHNILLLGLRGQAKTRIARLMTELLDEYIPFVAGSELNDDPFQPISRYAIDLIELHGDETPVSWLHRTERYVEKLATPDVSIADLIGDADPIKAATLKLPYSDERVIHFGLIPRSHRSIFVINELPDLQARIQVALFNILQEGDIQIRGFKLRLPLDLQFVFTANPEDYTNRGSIITPLKDRIDSQILTHYPRSIELAAKITAQEADLSPDQRNSISVPELCSDLLERIVFTARSSEFVDEKSGVSARLSISAMENLYSTAERRMLINAQEKTTARIADFWGIIPAITGKIELVYEGEQEGPYNVALRLIGEAVKEKFLSVFPNPTKLKKGKDKDPYGTIAAFFSDGNVVSLLNDDADKNYKEKLMAVPGLEKIVLEQSSPKNEAEKLLFMEFVLHALCEFELIAKDFVDKTMLFRDPLADALGDLFKDDEN
jgi:magnesium chelatase subunit I